jgi:hypothetical protein
MGGDAESCACHRPTVGVAVAGSDRESWKGFTGLEANKLLKRTGDSFWSREYYDHIVRGDEERA